MNCIKKFFRRLASWFVVTWANYVYKQMVEKADEAYSKTGDMIYVASEPFRPDVLTLYNRSRFKTEKQVWGYGARILTLQTLKNGCYYHTPDRVGNQGMTAHDAEVRRLFFVKERLHKAKLL